MMATLSDAEQCLLATSSVARRLSIAEMAVGANRCFVSKIMP